MLLRPAVTSTSLHVAQSSVQTIRVPSITAVPRPAKLLVTVLQTTSAQEEQVGIPTAQSAQAVVKLEVQNVKVTNGAHSHAA